MPRILYVCDTCWDENPEGCGYTSPKELRVTPDHGWMCENCWTDGPLAEDEKAGLWRDLPIPPEYVPQR